MSASQDAAGDFVGSEVDYQRRLREMQLWNYAVASGLPGIPQTPSPATPAPSPAPASATATATASGLSGLAKAGLIAGSLVTGGGLLGLGTFLGGAFTKPAATVVQPAVGPNGQVTIGIGPDGNFFDPNAGAAK